MAKLWLCISCARAVLSQLVVRSPALLMDD